MIQEKTHDLILQLKRIKDERELSYQRIIDMVEASGGCTSLSTVRRVFAPDSENKSFRYDDSIRPLVVALLGINDPPLEGGEQSPEHQEIAALKTVIAIKNQTNEDLTAEHERVKADYEKKLAYIKNEAAQKHEHILELTAQIKRKDRSIFWLSFVLIALLLLAVAALVIDRIDPNLGYFWRSIVSFSGNSDLVGSVNDFCNTTLFWVMP